MTRSTWVRLLSKSIVAKEQPALARPLTPLQCGVGMRGGAELIIHSSRHLLSAHPSWSLTTLDIANAYGTISRAAIRRALSASAAPHAFSLTYFDRFCAPKFLIRHGRDYQVQVAEGVIQGDPISPLLFSLGLHPSLEAASASLQSQAPEARLFAYLDDICLVGPSVAIPQAYAILSAHVQAAHLAFNSSKAQVFSPQASSSDVPPETQTLLTYLGARLALPDVKLLGSTISTSLFGPDPLAGPIPDSEEDTRLFRRLDSSPSLQHRLLLLRFSITRAYIHHLRTTPPEWTNHMCLRVDSLIARSLALLCGCSPGDPLSPPVLMEALLPASQGGLGIPCLKELRPFAYAASVLATIQQWRRFVTDDNPLLASWGSSTALTNALELVHSMVRASGSATVPAPVFPATAKEALVYSQTNKLQQFLQRCRDLQIKRQLSEQHLVTNLARAQFLSKTARGASAFLQACPSDPGLRLSNVDMALSLRLWLRLPILPFFSAPTSLSCFCTPSTPLSEPHILNCNGAAARDVRHNTLVLVFEDMLKAAVQNPVIREPRAQPHSPDHHRFDLSVAAFDSASRNLKLDVTVRNPQAFHLVSKAAAVQLAAASDAVASKTAKYSKYLAPADEFIPLAIESFGALHPNVFRLVATCANRVGNLPPDSVSFLAPSFAAYWLQRISCALMRENARLIQLIVGSSLRLNGIHDRDEDASPLLDALVPDLTPASALDSPIEA